MLSTILDKQLLTSGQWTFTVGQLIGLLITAGLIFLAWKVTRAVWRIKFYNKYKVDKPKARRFESLLRQLIILVGSFGIVKLLNLDPVFYQNEQISLRFSIFLVLLIVLVGSKIIDWVLSNILTHSYDKGHDAEKSIDYVNRVTREELIKKATRTVRYIIFILMAIVVLRHFNLDLSFYSNQIDGQEVNFNLSKLLFVGLILLCARLLAWVLVNIGLYGVYRNRDIDEGSQFAINQLLKYVIYFIAFFMSLNTMGINMTLLLGGAAALLVGVGLGLQQTFNDFFSGLVLLFERSVSVGDILTIDNIQGTVKKIGLRSSIVETLGNRNIVIPNSKLVNESIVNWNHFDDVVRFDVAVGVAYGSDTALVKDLLLQSVSDHLDILQYPSPFVRFNNFGDSSLDFTIYFFTDQLITTENLKSDIRFKIDSLFRENNISIPFPQRDIWMRKD